MLCLFAVYIPVLLIGDTVQAAVMLTGLVIAVALGLLAKNPKLAWLNDFIMAFSMIGGMISSVFWCKLFLSIIVYNCHFVMAIYATCIIRQPLPLS